MVLWQESGYAPVHKEEGEDAERCEQCDQWREHCTCSRCDCGKLAAFVCDGTPVCAGCDQLVENAHPETAHDHRALPGRPVPSTY